MAALVFGMFWLRFCSVAGNGDVAAIFVWVNGLDFVGKDWTDDCGDMEHRLQDGLCWTSRRHVIQLWDGFCTTLEVRSAVRRLTVNVILRPSSTRSHEPRMNLGLRLWIKPGSNKEMERLLPPKHQISQPMLDWKAETQNCCGYRNCPSEVGADRGPGW